MTPNPRFLFFSAKHREAFNHLLYGIRERKGFVQLTGEVGAGKTTVCRAMLEALGDSWASALIFNPPPDPDLLVKAVAIEFGLAAAGLGVLETRAKLNEFLIEQAAAGRDAVLIIDEAQNLTNHQLEHIRLLSNLETDDRKLLQIVLMGQPELRARLDDPILRQLRQRITGGLRGADELSFALRAGGSIGCGPGVVRMVFLEVVAEQRRISSNGRWGVNGCVSGKIKNVSEAGSAEAAHQSQHQHRRTNEFSR